MIFYLSLVLDLFLAFAIGNNFWTGLVFYLLFSGITTCVFMLLGRNVQRVLKKKSTFFIIYEDDYLLTGVNSNNKKSVSIARSSIAKEAYDCIELAPYFTIEAWELTLLGRLTSIREPKTVYKITLYRPVA